MAITAGVLDAPGSVSGSFDGAQGVEEWGGRASWSAPVGQWRCGVVAMLTMTQLALKGNRSEHVREGHGPARHEALAGVQFLRSDIVVDRSVGAARSRVKRARARIAPYGNGQAYQNYADLALAGARRA